MGMAWAWHGTLWHKYMHAAGQVNRGVVGEGSIDQTDGYL